MGEKHIETDTNATCPICKHWGIDVYYNHTGYSYRCSCGHKWDAESYNRLEKSYRNKLEEELLDY